MKAFDKNDIRKEINKELTALGGKAFTEPEYRTHQDAMTLLSMKEGSYKFESSDSIDRMGEYRHFLRIISQTTEEFFVKDIKEATSRALGIQHKPLINEIADAAYMFTGMTHSCHECGHTTEADDMQAKIDSWVNYCSMVDKAIIAMKKFPKSWDDMKKKQKDEYLKPLKSIALATNDPMLNVILHFAENYGRHQGVRAQANALLVQQLPNITTYDIAKKVTTHTSLNKPQ